MEDHHAIQVQGLQKRFGEIRAVQDASFDVAQGEIFSLLGPNGAGKSTTGDYGQCVFSRRSPAAHSLGDGGPAEHCGARFGTGIRPTAGVGAAGLHSGLLWAGGVAVPV